MSRVVGMKVVPVVVGGEVAGRLGRVMRSRILVHNSVATAAGSANKAVDLLPLLLLRRCPVIRSFEWCQRRTDKADVSLVRPRYQALQPSDQRLTRRRGLVAEIVDRIVGEDDPAHIRLLQYVSLKAVLGAFARTIDEKSVSTDSHIEDPNLNTLADETEGQLVRPSMVRIVRRCIPFGNRSEERRDAASERRAAQLEAAVQA